MGHITTLGLHRERVSFDGNTTTHHYFICTECGMTRDLHNEERDSLEAPEEAERLGRVEATHVELRGLCSGCSKGDEQGQDRSQ